MKLLLKLFVVLTVLSSLCTGRAISRALCEKIKTCKQRNLHTPVPTPEHVYLPQNDENKHSPLFYKNARNRHYGHFSAQGPIIAQIFCPGGAHKLASGRCSSPKSSKLYDYRDVFYDY